MASSEVTPASASAGRTRRAALTWASQVLYTLVTMTLGLFTTPWLLRFLGAERFGAFRAMGEWFGYLLLTDLGMSAAISVFLLRAQSRGNRDEAAAITRFGLRFMAAFALAIMIPIGLVMAWYMPELVRVSPGLASELRLASFLGLLAFALYPMGVFRSVLDSAQRGYVVIGALFVQSLLITVLSLWLAYSDRGLVGQSLATVVGIIAYSAVLALGAWHVLGSFRRGPPSAISWRSLGSVAWPLVIANVCSRVNQLTDNVVIGFMLGPAQVTILFFTQRFIFLAAGQIGALAGASWAGLAEMRATGETAGFEARVLELSRLTLGVGTVLVGTAAGFNSHLVRLWVGLAQFGGNFLTQLTVGTAVVYAFMVLFIMIIDSHGDTRHRLRVSTLGSAINLVLSIALVRTMGLAGVTLGTLIAYLTTDAWYCPYVVCKRYGVSGRKLAAATLTGLGIGLPWAIASWFLINQYLWPKNWFQLIAYCVVVGSAAVAYCWLAVLNSAERDQWRRRIARARKRSAVVAN